MRIRCAISLYEIGGVYLEMFCHHQILCMNSTLMIHILDVTVVNFDSVINMTLQRSQKSVTVQPFNNSLLNNGNLQHIGQNLNDKNDHLY